MTYTAGMNRIFYLPSGNWFTGFIAHEDTRTVSFTYHDRRRSGQIARRYTIVFSEDLKAVKEITAVSARGGRVEKFSRTRAEDFCRGLLLKARFEEDEEEEDVPPFEESPTKWYYSSIFFMLTFLAFVGLFIIALSNSVNYN